MTSSVRAQAIVDTQRPGLIGLARGLYRVTVRGRNRSGALPERVYDLEAHEQGDAAREGLRLYEGEFAPAPRVDPRRLVW